MTKLSIVALLAAIAVNASVVSYDMYWTSSERKLEQNLSDWSSEKSYVPRPYKETIRLGTEGKIEMRCAQFWENAPSWCIWDYAHI